MQNYFFRESGGAAAAVQCSAGPRAGNNSVNTAAPQTPANILQSSQILTSVYINIHCNQRRNACLQNFH